MSVGNELVCILQILMTNKETFHDIITFHYLYRRIISNFRCQLIEISLLEKVSLFKRSFWNIKEDTRLIMSLCMSIVYSLIIYLLINKTYHELYWLKNDFFVKTSICFDTNSKSSSKKLNSSLLFPVCLFNSLM